MDRLSLEGTLLRAGGVVCRVLHSIEASTLRLENIATGDVRECDASKLEAALQQRTVIKVSDSTPHHHAAAALMRPDEFTPVVDAIPAALRSDAAVAVLVTKYRWISRLKHHGLRKFRPGPELALAIKEVEHATGEQCPYGLDAIYEAFRTLRRFEHHPRSLLPKFHLRGGPGGHRLDPIVEGFIDTALASARNPATGLLRASRIWETVQSCVQQANRVRDSDPLRIPSVPTVTRRFKDKFTAYEIAVRNLGKDRADQVFRETRARIRAVNALDVVLYDDTDTCVFLCDDRTTLPWGRAYLTAGIDEATSNVMGKAMSEAPRSTETALLAVMNGIFAKQHDHEEFSLCSGKWMPHGHHGLVVLDNASYNTTMGLEASLLEFGCEVELVRPHRPADKSDIEHFNARLKSEFVANLPGWSGPKEDREMLKRGMGTAVLTFSVFAKKLNAYIVDEYSNKPIKGGRSPRQLWESAFQYHPPLPPKRMPAHELLGTIPCELTFRDSGGLLRLGLRYASDELAQLRRLVGARAKVRARYVPWSVAFLYVLNPITNTYLKVPCIEDERYVRYLTNYQQRLILKACRESKRNSPTIADMVMAREKLALDTARLATSTRMRERKRSVRQYEAGFNNDNALNSASASAFARSTEIVVVSELEAMVASISEVDIDADFEFSASIGGAEFTRGTCESNGPLSAP